MTFSTHFAGPLLPGEEPCDLHEVAALMQQAAREHLHELRNDAAVILRDVRLTPAQRTVLAEALQAAAHSAGLLSLLGKV